MEEAPLGLLLPAWALINKRLQAEGEAPLGLLLPAWALINKRLQAEGEVPLGLLLPAWALIVLNFYVGMHAQPLLSLAHDAASGLF